MEQANPIDALYATAKQHGIPMAAICDRAKVDPTTPSRWKRGKNGATLDTLTALSSALSGIIADRATPEAPAQVGVAA